MKKPPVIGVAGLARSGKDTVADFIVSYVGGYRYAFAEPIKAMLRHVGIDMDHPYWASRKEDRIPAVGKSPREMMQTLGTDWGRELVNPKLWVTLANQKLLTYGPGMVISDVRFDNEAEWIRSLGGLVIHVHRDINDFKIAEHSSENGVIVLDTDVTILNSGTLEDLQEKTKLIFDVKET